MTAVLHHDGFRGPLKILKYPWHIGHDYELCKLDAQYFFLADTSRSWATQQRPVPANLRFVSSLATPETDLMILHVDQWILNEPAKLRLFQHWRDRYRGPKVVINHGCNLVDGCSSAAMRDLVGDLPVVCNSTTAKKLWALPNSRYVRHGMSPDEWPATDYSDHRAVVIQAFDVDRHPEYRNAGGVAAVEKSVALTWVGRDIRFTNFADYRDFLSHASIYFNPSHASPNPRTRTEAMLCGMTVVTTDSHGESDYIDHGVNGYVSNDLDELAECLRELLADRRLAERVGRAGRETARELFSSDAFLERWKSLIGDVLAGRSLSA
jgi:hypothetical protein